MSVPGLASTVKLSLMMLRGDVCVRYTRKYVEGFSLSGFFSTVS